MKSLLRRATLAVLALMAIGVGGFAVVWSRADTSNVGSLGFEQPLRIPPLLEPTEDAAGRKVFELEMRAGTSELLPGRRTQTWGFNGPHLGPTLRASRGDVVQMRVANRLPETSTVHWHGMHLPAEADGGPHQPIDPGQTWSPSWTIDQPAAALWYHPHPHGETEEHVYRGLAGMFILDDATSRRLALPHDYGTDDVPVIVQDKRFDDDGQLSFSQGIISPIGQLGDTILVNGTHAPHLDVTTTRVRLRLLNASTARAYDFGFADHRRIDLIATGGGLLDAPRRLERVQLSPAERAEIVVELAPGDDVVLRSFEPDLGADPFTSRFAGADDTFDILQLRAASHLRPSPPLPARLAPRPAPNPGEAARVRRFELGSRDINDRKMDMSRIDQTVPVDTTEIWEIANRAGTPHNFHVHDTRFRVLEVRGRAAAGGPQRPEGHRRDPARRDRPPPRPVQRLHRLEHPVHVPLPPSRARGPRDDGPVRGRPAGPSSPDPTAHGSPRTLTRPAGLHRDHARRVRTASDGARALATQPTTRAAPHRSKRRPPSVSVLRGRHHGQRRPKPSGVAQGDPPTTIHAWLPDG